MTRLTVRGLWPEGAYASSCVAPWDTLSVRAEPENEADPNAIAVLRNNGPGGGLVHVGYVSKEEAADPALRGVLLGPLPPALVVRSWGPWEGVLEVSFTAQ